MFESIAKGVLSSALKVAAAFLKDSWAKKRAYSKAMNGEDLAHRGTLKRIVTKELENLADSPDLPQNLQNDGFRKWLLTEASIEQFVEVVLSDAGGIPAFSQRERSALAKRYAQTTGEDLRLAEGPINLVVSLVRGQLDATEANSRALQTALSFRHSAQIKGLMDPSLRPFPSEADIERLGTLSAQLLVAARTSWQMPAFVAPLTLEAQDASEDGQSLPVTQRELVDVIQSGGDFVLFGEGGVGKTTFLLELAALCSDNKDGPIPLFVDAAIWARSGQGILEYLGNTPPAKKVGLTGEALIKLASDGYLALLVNGWNEIPTDLKYFCLETLNLLIATSPSLPVAVVTRSEHDTARLRSPRKIYVRGLTWHGQSAVVRSELKDERADAMLEVLGKDTRLRHAARSPLILRGLLSQAKTRSSISTKAFDLLGAVIETLESDTKRKLSLEEAPVLGLHTRYLEAIAHSLNAIGTTNLSQGEALSVIGSAATAMVSERILGTPPQPKQVLDVLASHHVLHIQDGFVRFAHQRFQEYFGALRLLRASGEKEKFLACLGDVVNFPSWSDSLELLAEKLKQPDGLSSARGWLVQATVAVDLSYCCDLVGLCGFTAADDTELHDRVASKVFELGESKVEETKELAIACKIASRLPTFANDLWVLFESDDQQTRLSSHRLNGSPVSILQLGAEAEERINKWSSGRRAEFIHEVAKNPDNYSYVVSVAMSDSNREVRAAAISALFWYYPASTAAVEAWLHAPLDVQTLGELVSAIRYWLEQGAADQQIDQKIRAHLITMSENEISNEARLRLALAFPAEAGPTSVSVVLDRLKSEDQRMDTKELVSIAEAHAPDQLQQLACELAKSERTMPQWAGELLLGEPASIREAAFEAAWNVLISGKVRRLSSQFVGPLSSQRQTKRSIAYWLEHYALLRGELTDIERERAYAVRDLLRHAPGGDMLSIAIELGNKTSYAESVQIVEMLLDRISQQKDQPVRASAWRLRPDEFRQLFDVFGGKSEGGHLPEDRLFTLLACIASEVDPSTFSSLLLGALERHLDAWTEYTALVEEWKKRPRLERPHNPHMGNYLISALTKWGIESLPGILKFRSHTNALDIVPEALSRVASHPWNSTRTGWFSDVSTDVQDGRQRRESGCELKQPSTAYQSTTDEVAKALAALLNAEVDRVLEERNNNPERTAKRSRVGTLVLKLARVPSKEIVAPVTRALASGLLDIWLFVDTVRALVRQGWIFDDADVVAEFEALYELETSAKWVDEQKRHKLCELSQLAFLVEPPSHLEHPLSFYVEQWQRFSSPMEIIGFLGRMKSEKAWPILLDIGSHLNLQGKVPDELLHALSSSLSAENFGSFADLIANGTLSSWCQREWTMRQIAPAVVELVRDTPENMTNLIEAWRTSASQMGDALLGEVLALVERSDEETWKLGLEALDAGRANDPNMPAYSMLENVFTRKVAIEENMFETTPKACPSLRLELYQRAKGCGEVGQAAQRLLASLECRRREAGRPLDEPRHPDLGDGQSWTKVLSPT